MIVRACAFTTEGWKLVDTLSECLEDLFFVKKNEDENLDEWVRTGFEYNAPILFVGAVGIAVRKIAPYVNNKLTDSPVVVVDDKGRFAVPLLSDHVGGAGELAEKIAAITKGQAVITTATDIRGLFAVDVFSRKNGLYITDKDGIKKVTSKLMDKGTISMAINPEITFSRSEVPECIEIVEYEGKRADVVIDNVSGFGKKNNDTLLTLIYKPFVIGVGCKKGTDFASIDGFIKGVFADNDIDIRMVSDMASIDLKKDEAGLLYFESRERIPFSVYSAELLQAVEGDFSESEFVKNITGVSCVCERAAILKAGDGAELVIPKTVGEGMTIAVSRRKARITVWEE